VFLSSVSFHSSGWYRRPAGDLRLLIILSPKAILNDWDAPALSSWSNFSVIHTLSKFQWTNQESHKKCIIVIWTLRVSTVIRRLDMAACNKAQKCPNYIPLHRSSLRDYISYMVIVHIHTWRHWQLLSVFSTHNPCYLFLVYLTTFSVAKIV
jgi:hypothetical protein